MDRVLPDRIYWVEGDEWSGTWGAAKAFVAPDESAAYIRAAWQPIETAPKDGTKVDLWDGHRRWADMFWDANGTAGEVGRREGWRDGTGYLFAPYGFKCWLPAAPPPSE